MTLSEAAFSKMSDTLQCQRGGLTYVQDNGGADPRLVHAVLQIRSLPTDTTLHRLNLPITSLHLQWGVRNNNSKTELLVLGAHPPSPQPLNERLGSGVLRNDRDSNSQVGGTYDLPNPLHPSHPNPTNPAFLPFSCGGTLALSKMGRGGGGKKDKVNAKEKDEDKEKEKDKGGAKEKDKEKEKDKRGVRRR
jgi:hypothetical protein